MWWQEILAATLLCASVVASYATLAPYAVPLNGNERTASVPRATIFLGQGGHSGAGFQTLTQDEQDAFISGIYNLDHVRPQCDSGNCTFAPYTSIGFCSTCRDISADVQFVAHNSSSNNGVWSTGSIVNGETEGSWITSSIPGVFSYDASTSTNYTASLENITPFEYGRYFASASTKSNRTTMVMGPPNTNDEGALVDCSHNRTWACQGYAGSSCDLTPCIRNYTARMSNGVFQEEVMDTWMGIFEEGTLTDKTWVISTINKSCLTQTQSEALIAINYTLNDDGPWLAYHGSSTEDPPIGLAEIEQDLLDRQCLFAVDAPFTHGLEDHISGPLVAGNVTGRYAPGIYFLSFAGPPVMLAIYNSGDISLERTQSVWTNLSLALTNHMRINPYLTTGQRDRTGTSKYNLLNATAPASGVACATKTCLQVRWGWLAFPTVLAVLTLIFFAGAIFSTGGLTRDVRTWKSSPLPLLFYGGSLSDTPADSQHVDDLNRAAKRTNVGLVRDEEGNMVLRKRGAVIDRDSEI
ncbi:unnamed protein product [Zymoseptoria tritici ST99CH_1E4]|uniref:Uncharacterized protein n=1 Tax=Zymoseptoria tritici ST99CH_1E4 TaxID=1276532 RepID=A0A2H1H5R2_ZYMTR|nr:unnamed protein product [Zymoseptoria tritici ST99CH_1E4]